MKNQYGTSSLFDRVKFDIDSAQAASDQWGFNCGPGALCAVTGRTPEELRPFLGDFETKGYMSPSMMATYLRDEGISFRRVFESAANCTRDTLQTPIYPKFGLVRIQWDGQWCNTGVPIVARYRKTHWIAYASEEYTSSRAMVFDINAIRVCGWIMFEEWSQSLAPWLISQCVKGGSGKWWPTHCWEITS